MCSTVASSPILALQLAERALNACNYPQNHLLALSVDVIRQRQPRAAQYATCANQFPKKAFKIFLSPEWLTANFLLSLHHWH